MYSKYNLKKKGIIASLSGLSIMVMVILYNIYNYL